MLKQFELHISKNDLFTRQNKLILAISGGPDSVVLAHLLHNAGFKFSMAHCNFKLRGKESDADEAFCKQLAKTLKVSFHTQNFNTKLYSKKHKISAQMAARELRYEWFNQLLKEQEADYLLTAHHAGDMVETILINLIRGTGINGLKGIPQKAQHVVRPLLPFTKKDIDAYAQQHKIKYRLDKSNLEDKYERNFIRLHIVPLLKKLNPELENTFLKNTSHFTQESSIVNEYLTHKREELLKIKNSETFIDKENLNQQKHKESLIHFMLAPFGFNQTQLHNILNAISHKQIPGKSFFSKNYQLTIDRKEIIISPLSTEPKTEIKIHTLPELQNLKNISLFKKTTFKLPAKHELLINERHLVFPLTLRAWKTGDKFKPFGMRGFKLLSDFFKDQKLNAIEKQKVRLLVNGNSDIIWVCGYRSDERYRVKPNDKDLLKLVYAG